MDIIDAQTCSGVSFSPHQDACAAERRIVHVRFEMTAYRVSWQYPRMATGDMLRVSTTSSVDSSL